MRHQSERQTEGGDGKLELVRFSQRRERDTQHAHTNKQGIQGPLLFKESNVRVMRSCTMTRKWIGRNLFSILASCSDLYAYESHRDFLQATRKRRRQRGRQRRNSGGRKGGPPGTEAGGWEGKDGKRKRMRECDDGGRAGRAASKEIGGGDDGE